MLQRLLLMPLMLLFSFSLLVHSVSGVRARKKKKKKAEGISVVGGCVASVTVCAAGRCCKRAGASMGCTLLLFCGVWFAGFLKFICFLGA